MRGWFFVSAKYIDNTINKCYTYTYDEVSNVTEEYIGGVLFKDYEYDNDNRLVKTTVTAGGMLGYNMFAYCSNNPIINWDPVGLSSNDIEIDENIGAIYYVNYDFLKKAGHASLFYKYDGKWYMIQLKSCDEDYGIALEVIVATLSTVLSQLNDNAIPLETFAIEQREYIGDFKDVMDRIPDTKNRYEIAFLLGDFSAIHTDSTPTNPGDVITSIHRYNLLQYNCNHYIKQQLQKCNNAEVTKRFGNCIVPRNTFKRLKNYYLTEL